MKWILLAYLLLALRGRPQRGRMRVQMARLGHALALWVRLRRPWRVAWFAACRRHP